MNSFIKRAVLVLLILSTTGCARTCSKQSREWSGNRDYIIKQYSGGVVVGQWRFHGVVNNSDDNSDGIYFYCNDTLVELSGDIQILSVDSIL